MSRTKGNKMATTGNIRGSWDAVLPLIKGSNQEKAHSWLLRQGNSVTEEKIAIEAGIHFTDVCGTMASLREVCLAEYLNKTKPVKWKAFPLDAPRKTRQNPMKEPSNRIVKAIAATREATRIEVKAETEAAMVKKYNINVDDFIEDAIPPLFPPVEVEEELMENIKPNILVNAAQGLVDLIETTQADTPDFTVLEDEISVLQIEVQHLKTVNENLKGMLTDKWAKE